jgi:hypothetical protein
MMMLWIEDATAAGLFPERRPKQHEEVRSFLTKTAEENSEAFAAQLRAAGSSSKRRSV